MDKAKIEINQKKIEAAKAEIEENQKKIDEEKAEIDKIEKDQKQNGDKSEEVEDAGNSKAENNRIQIKSLKNSDDEDEEPITSKSVVRKANAIAKAKKDAEENLMKAQEEAYWKKVHKEDLKRAEEGQ